MASTAFNNHVFVFLQVNVVVIEIVKDADSTQLGWRATWFWHFCGVHQVHKRLHNGMICGVHVSIKREITFTRAKERTITIRCYYPVLPLQIFETHIESLNLTAFWVVIAWMRQWVSVFRLLFPPLLVCLTLCSCVVVSDVFLRLDHLKLESKLLFYYIHSFHSILTSWPLKNPTMNG